MGGFDKSRLMCCVRGRLSGKQPQISCFSQDSAATLFRWGGRVYNYLTWNFLRIMNMYIKVSKIGSFLPSYSKYKKDDVYQDTV